MQRNWPPNLRESSREPTGYAFSKQAHGIFGHWRKPWIKKQGDVSKKIETVTTYEKLDPDDIEDLEHLLQRSESFSGSGSPGSLMITAALELRAHGHREAASRVADRAVEWHERRDPSGTRRAGLAAALYVAERLEDARQAYERLSEAHPGDLAYLGALGAIAARGGDGDGARSVAKRLASLSASGRAGESAYLRACIVAQLGEKQEAVALLRESLGRGRKFSTYVHRDLDLEPLRGYPPFEDLLRPEE